MLDLFLRISLLQDTSLVCSLDRSAASLSRPALTSFLTILSTTVFSASGWA